LAADAGVSDEVIASRLSVGGSTVYRTKRRFVQANLDLALSEGSRPGTTRKPSGKETALLIATPCSSPPQGRKRGTLDLAADRPRCLAGCAPRPVCRVMRRRFGWG
jgi:hypothetical protein